MIVVLSVAELSAGSLSGSFASAVTVLLIVPNAVGCTTRVMVAMAPAARLGIEHVITLPERVRLPLSDVTETKEAPGGMVSVMTTPVASAPLLFVTRIV